MLETSTHRTDPARSDLTRSPLAFIGGYVRARALWFAALGALALSAASCAVGVQVMMKLLVDGMAGGPARSGAVWTALAAFLGLVLVESLLWRASGWAGCRVTIAAGRDIRLDLFAHLGRHGMDFFAERFAGSLGHRITAVAGHFGALVNAMVWRVAPPCVDFVGALIVFSMVDWRMAAAMALFAAGTTASLVALGRRGRPVHQAYAERAGEAGGELVDVLANIWNVKAFSAARSERARLARAFDAEARAQRRSWMFLEKARALHDLALTAMAAGMLAWVVWLWSQSRVTPGDVVVVSALTFRILHGSRDLALAFVDTAQQFSFIGETLRFLGAPRAVEDRPRAVAAPRCRGELTLRDVRFSYPDGREALSGVALAIPAGQRVGVVGPSGAGKSTLVNLIQRLHDPQSGRILLDGVPIRDLTQDSLRANLGVVPQEVALFHRTIMENIRFARPEATDEEVREAAAAAQCDAFIRRMPHGYHSHVGDRGVKLSGGQRQRIGVARVLLKDAPVVLLDEATSALDTKSEQEVQAALERLMRGRTVIAVAHRLSTIAGFDRVLVMMDGAIVEDGEPATLLAREGPFRAMWRRQSGGLSAPPAAAGQARLRVVAAHGE
ncbi:ABC transporter ATP-binding protein [Alsobacter sp. SYSU BS001988]